MRIYSGAETVWEGDPHCEHEWREYVTIRNSNRGFRRLPCCGALPEDRFLPDFQKFEIAPEKVFQEKVLAPFREEIPHNEQNARGDGAFSEDGEVKNDVL